MAQQIIDIDTVQPNGKRGEPARSMSQKINANCTELYTGKVSKGSNGSWPDAIPSAWNAWEGPRVIQSYASGTPNTPSAFGVALAWANVAPDASGNFTRGSGRWINQLAFGTSNDVYFSQSINGAQFGAWRQFWHSGNTTVDANNFIKRA
ncbi:hypothetical protein I5V28_05385 [Stenotrophomonas maltophilia]|uniref:hypothetical protein n=1 Tax=Stenotrophomonas maltophilia group sp. Smal32 TaxID=3377164 RepID=UPI0018D39E4B|nr:hypothetical protein [Stenotrophomonas maltophilia]MBH1745260.1 hypothetical protein [Stenotrophomonas maltophilia]